MKIVVKWALGIYLLLWDFIPSILYQENMLLDRMKPIFYLCWDTLLWFIVSFFPCRPLFERISIDLNPSSTPPKKLTITAIGARSKPYIKSLTINGIGINQPVIKHEQIANGAEVVFEMSDKIEMWGNDDGVLKAFGVGVGLSSSSEMDKEYFFHNELWNKKEKRVDWIWTGELERMNWSCDSRNIYVSRLYI